jgi:predicted transposase YbfD/YdcC
VVGDGVSSADQIVAVPEGVLNTPPFGLSTTDVHLLTKSDTCYKRLEQEEAKIKAKALPSTEAKAKAWSKAVEAYWAWANLEMEGPKKAEDLEEIRGRKRRRILQLKELATRKMIYRLRAKMGPRFANLKDPPLPAARSLEQTSPER